ncbi:MAG: GNAT family N-acetyltransferase [Clostridia bacterium]|nr:GNAT family N-acetyltransferase [Clostridia bacterium]
MSTNVTITEASESDAELIWEMQKVAFADLLEKYEDYDTSPANETLDKVKSRFEDPYTYHYFIEAENQIVGALRIVDRKSEENKKLSQILILPEFRRKGYAYSAIRRAENIHGSTGWELDTILQEKSLRLMYESLGYRRTDYTRVVNYKMTLVGYKK